MAINGEVTFNMLKEEGFLYDSSMPAQETGDPFWPYTLDFGTQHICTIQPCPKESFPGIWEIPMNILSGSLGFNCPMVDGCPRPDNKRQALDLFRENFDKHYNSNKAPLLLAFHAGWLRTSGYLEAFNQFIDEILAKGDVWIVTNYQVIEWIKNPTPLKKLNNFQPFSCNVADRQGKCLTENQTQCPYEVGLDMYYVNMCKAPCPVEYPWVGSPMGKKCSYKCEFTAYVKERRKLLESRRKSQQKQG